MIEATWQQDYGYVRFVVTGLAPNPNLTVYRVSSNRLVPIPGFTDNTWLLNGVGYGEDYTPPLGEWVTYVLASPNADSPVDAVESTKVWVPGNQAWLRSPSNPIMSVPVAVVDTGAENLEVREYIHEVAARRLPIVVFDVREGRTGQVTLLVRSRQERTAIEALLADGAPLLLNVCNAKGFEPCFMAVGNAVFTRWGRGDGSYNGIPVDGPTWTLVLDYVEVEYDALLGERIPYLVWQQVRDEGEDDDGNQMTRHWSDVSDSGLKWLDVVNDRFFWS